MVNHFVINEVVFVDELESSQIDLRVKCGQFVNIQFAKA